MRTIMFIKMGHKSYCLSAETDKNHILTVLPSCITLPEKILLYYTNNLSYD